MTDLPPDDRALVLQLCAFGCEPTPRGLTLGLKPQSQTNTCISCGTRHVLQPRLNAAGKLVASVCTQCFTLNPLWRAAGPTTLPEMGGLEVDVDPDAVMVLGSRAMARKLGMTPKDAAPELGLDRVEFPAADELVACVATYLRVCGVPPHHVPSSGALASVVFAAVAKLGTILFSKETRQANSSDAREDHKPWVNRFVLPPEVPVPASASVTRVEWARVAKHWSAFGLATVKARPQKMFSDGLVCLAAPGRGLSGSVVKAVVVAAVTAYLLGPGSAHADVGAEVLQFTMRWLACEQPPQVPVGLLKALVDGVTAAAERVVVPPSAPAAEIEWARLVHGLPLEVASGGGWPWYPVVRTGLAGATDRDFVYQEAPARFVAVVRLLGVLDTHLDHAITTGEAAVAWGASQGVFTQRFLFEVCKLWVAVTSVAPSMSDASACAGFLLLAAWLLVPELSALEEGAKSTAEQRKRGLLAATAVHTVTGVCVATCTKKAKELVGGLLPVCVAAQSDADCALSESTALWGFIESKWPRLAACVLETM